MSGFIFVLLMIICFGLFYVVHRYFGKHEFYLLTVIYSVLGFILSFKLVNIFGFDRNLGIVFTSGILLNLYYFIYKFGKGEIKKFIEVVMISVISVDIIMIINALMVPSIYDEVLGLFQNLLFENYMIFILYPVILFGILLLCMYSFNELRSVEKYKELKTILTIIGIMFIYVFTFMYFSYAVIFRFTDSLSISLDNYFVSTIVMIIYYLCGNRVMKMKKVKA